MHYYVINITKWSNFTEHYYANVYHFNTFSEPDWFADGHIDLSVAENYSELYPELYPTTKDSCEKDLINKVADNIIEQLGGLSAFVGVSWRGRYSHSRTLSITNNKAMPLKPKEILY